MTRIRGCGRAVTPSGSRQGKDRNDRRYNRHDRDSRDNSPALGTRVSLDQCPGDTRDDRVRLADINASPLFDFVFPRQIMLGNWLAGALLGISRPCGSW